MNKGMLLPLDSWMERDSISPDAYGGVLEQLRTGGHLYELPFRRDFWVLFYNKELFDRAGLNYPSNDMTLEEYDRLGRKLVELSKYDKIFGTHYHTWRSTVQLFGILDGEHRLLEGPYDYLIPYYEMALRQQGDHICQDYTTLRIQNIGYQGAFEEGKVGMMNMGTWYIMTLMNNIASGQSKGLSQWGIVKYPHPDGVPAGTTACTVASLGIPARSQHPEEAWEFVKFACGSEGARILAGEGSLPALMDEQAIDAIVSLEGFPEDEASREALFTGETFLELPVDAQSPRIDKILNTVHDKIMMEKCTIEEGIEELERLVKEVE